MGIEVDPCFFLTKQQPEDLTSGNFNPGDCLTLFVLCDCGVLILACVGMSLAHQEKPKSRKMAEGASSTNRSLLEALQLRSATDPPAPPDYSKHLIC